MPAGGEELARRFYAGVLAIPEVPKPFPQNTRGGAWFETAEIRIHLGVEQDFRPARKAHPAILVSDLKSLTDRLQAAGIAVVAGEPLEGYEHIYVSDPFDNRIEFLQAK
jgi:catechol 2,3-dioxygenase-like lactoylglutathione lyase family enzyme